MIFIFNYDNLKQYVVPQGKLIRCGEQQHCFYAIDEMEISKAENMLSLQFPNELKEFYLQIGYGYLGYDNPNFRNQIMHPLEIAKLELGLDFYGNMYEEDLKYYTSESVFPFFDLGGEADYLVIQMGGEFDGSVLYLDAPIASSFNDFVAKMCERTDYFI